MSDIVKRLRVKHAETIDTTGCSKSLSGDAADEIDRLRAERDKAVAERDALREDAERYRWLRQHTELFDDEAIDAAKEIA